MTLARFSNSLSAAVIDYWHVDNVDLLMKRKYLLKKLSVLETCDHRVEPASNARTRGNRYTQVSHLRLVTVIHALLCLSREEEEDTNVCLERCCPKIMNRNDDKCRRSAGSLVIMAELFIQFWVQNCWPKGEPTFVLTWNEGPYTPGNKPSDANKRRKNAHFSCTTPSARRICI